MVSGKPLLKEYGIQYDVIDTGVSDNRAAELTSSREFQQKIISQIFAVPVAYLGDEGNFDLENAQLAGLNDEESWEVVRQLSNFPAMVRRAVEEYEPSVIAKYSIHLSKSFNKYYAHTKVLTDDDQKDSRLAMVASVAIVLKESLRLLGVNAPNEM